MKKLLFLLVGLMVFYSCQKESPQSIISELSKTEALIESSQEQVAVEIENDIVYNPTATQHRKKIKPYFLAPPPTLCDDLDIDIFRVQDQAGCCMYNVAIYHDNFDDSMPEIEVEWAIDGVFQGGASSIVGMSFPVSVCNGPVLLEIFSNGVLCHTELLTCKGQTCCSQLSYTFTSYQDGDCCVFEFNVNDPTGCWEQAMAFQFNSDIGPPDLFIWSDTGVTVHVCDPEQRIRFLVWDDLDFTNMCYSSSWVNNNTCKS